MPRPAVYTNSITVQGSVDDFRDILDPRRWSQNAPLIWLKSYLLEEGATLPDDETVNPEPEDDLIEADIWARPLSALLLEDVMVAGIRYRNLLAVSFENTRGDAIRFNYREQQCLTTTTKDGVVVSGGVDVDNGFSEARATEPDFVTVKVQKTVRFTQPSRFSGRLNALAEIVVPLALDYWLQNVIFKRP